MRSFTARVAAAAARLLIVADRRLGWFVAGRRTRSSGDFRVDALVEQQKAESLRFRTALNNMSQGLCFFDGDSRMIVCNDRYAEMYGLSPDLCKPGTPLQEIVEQRYRVGSAPRIEADEYLSWRASIVAVNQASDTLTELRDGRTFSIHHRPMPDGGWVATHEDITERRRAQEQIARMAHHDALTAIPNRVMFRERLEASLAREGAAVAVLTVDLDGFKAVNDTLGHPIGDALLRAVAQRLGECVRDGDLVARLGGDEFAIIQSSAVHIDLVRALGERLVAVIDDPFDVAGHRVSVGASVGAAIAEPGAGNDVDALLYQADLALYEAKAQGRGRLCLFSSALGDRARERRELVADLHHALERGQLEVHYQPIVSTSATPGDGRLRVVVFEALLRWNHPTRGRVMPDGFIAVAEEIGVIGDIGAWVLRTAFAEAARWPSGVAVAVNLSPLQFAGGDLVGDVEAALMSSGLAASRVELEITESVRLAENAANRGLLHRLRELGVRVCLDDFGVGYSSLSYLRSFPFDKIKIDRSFVRDMTSHREAEAIVRAIAALARSLGMSVTAEGVESAEQCASLQEMGCDELQGYWLGRPGPAGEVLAVLQRSWTTAEPAWPFATAQDARSRAAA